MNDSALMILVEISQYLERIAEALESIEDNQRSCDDRQEVDYADVI